MRFAKPAMLMAMIILFSLAIQPVSAKTLYWGAEDLCGCQSDHDYNDGGGSIMANGLTAVGDAFSAFRVTVPGYGNSFDGPNKEFDNWLKGDGGLANPSFNSPHLGAPEYWSYNGGTIPTVFFTSQGTVTITLALEVSAFANANSYYWYTPGGQEHLLFAGATGPLTSVSFDPGPGMWGLEVKTPVGNFLSGNSDHFTIAQESGIGVPEPATNVLMGAGLVGLALLRRRCARRRQ